MANSKLKKIFIKSSMDNDVLEVIGEIKGEKTNGYNLESGAWALSGQGNSGAVPAVFVIIRHKNCQKSRVYAKERIVKIEDL